MANYIGTLNQLSKPGVIDTDIQKALLTNNALYWAMAGKPDFKGKAKAKPKIKEETMTGTGYFETYILLDENDNIGWVDASEGLDVETLTFGDRPKIPIQSLVGTIPLPTRDLDLNNANTERLVKLTTLAITQAQQTAVNKVSAGLFYVGTEYGAKGPYGLQYYLPNTVTSGSVAGISQADKANWRSYVKDAGANSFASYATEYIDVMLNECTYGGDSPDLLVFGKTNYGRFKKLLQLNQRYTDVSEITKAGFRNLEYAGAGCIMDGNQTTGVIHAIDTKYAELAFVKGCNFKISKWVEPTNEQYMSAKLTARLNMLFKSRKSSGKIKGFTTV